MVARQSYTLGELAELTNSRLEGDPDIRIDQVAALSQARPGQISFLANSRYRRELADTQASAVIVPVDLDDQALTGASLRSDNPYLTFARVARLLNPLPPVSPGVADGAWVAADAAVDPAAEIAPGAFVGAGAVVGAGTRIGPGAVVEDEAVIGNDCRIDGNVTIAARCRIGERVHINPGAVIGGEGFGFAHDGEGWEPVPQLGTVVIGDDVDIGANTTIDRGSQGDTVVENGCKIDNLVQIAHNVRVGEHTVIAACTGISGSTRIGRCCTIAGQVGMAGHLEIAAGTTFTGMAMVTGSVREAGVYSSGIPAMPARDWRRNAVRFRQLDTMARRIEQLEKALERTLNEQPEDP